MKAPETAQELEARTAIDSELQALRNVIEALNSVPLDAQIRILEFARDWTGKQPL